MLDPVKLEVFKNRFVSVTEEMGYCLNRTAFSANIKERRDFSCALFDSAAGMVAQAAHIPVHLGSMPMSVKSAITEIELEPGDMVMLNDPFAGGTHLPDITLVAPVCTDEGELVALVANRAHHADIGGMSPGSMPLATSIYQEGLIIPPVKVVRSGVIDQDLMRVIMKNVRTPSEREGDLYAQVSANLTGIKRFSELIEKNGRQTITDYMRYLNNYSESYMRKAIDRIPDGRYDFQDYMDDDGFSSDPIRLAVSICINGDRTTLDFSDSADQAKGNINAPASITRSAVMYVFRCLIPESVPTNDGCMKPINIITRRGSVLDPFEGAAVAGGNVETSQRVVDVVLGALSKALPQHIPAASQGTMNNVTIGGTDPLNGKRFSYYETIGGGTGASASGRGEDAIHSHMTNTLNTPIEALEFIYPLRVESYSVRRGSGGQGYHKGGDGVIRVLKLLCDADVSVLSERRVLSPYGLFGGKGARTGKNTVLRQGTKQEMPGKFSTTLESGDTLIIESPGGGGYGDSETDSKQQKKG